MANADAGLLKRKIRSDERVLVVGKTGSGKTYLCRYLLNPSYVQRLVVLDPKGRIDSKEWKLVPFDEGLEQLKQGKPARLRVPPQFDNADWEPYFWQIYAVGNVVVYVDELYGVGPQKGSRGLQALYTRGRELGIGVWGATQRPVDIPMVARSEAEWVFMFQLKLQTDREKMYEVIGPKAFLQLHDHQFLVYNDAMDTPVLYNRLVISRRQQM